jgi:hypothetical protein
VRHSDGTTVTTTTTGVTMNSTTDIAAVDARAGRGLVPAAASRMR